MNSNPSPSETWKVSLFCACGTGAEGEIPIRARERFLGVWESLHQGGVCKPCTRAQARAVLARYPDAATLTIQGRNPV